MKTINDTLPEIKPLFEILLEHGWIQPSEGYVDRFVLVHPVKGYIAETLEFPRPHLGIISKGGTHLFGGAIQTTDLYSILAGLPR